MLWPIVALPLAGWLVNIALGRRLSKRVSGAVGSLAVAASFVAATMAVRALVARPPAARVIEERLYTWIASGELDVPIAFRLDPLAAVLVLVVTGIGLLIHVYSLGYMHEEPPSEYARYFSYLNLFVAFMLVLVLGASFPVLFVGWEGVGLCSYLLIGFFFRRPAAAAAGNKAFIVNRVGDFAFLLGMVAAFWHFRTLDIAAIAAQVAARPPEATFGPVSLVTLLLFVGATGKSAQIPLYVWLPDAMEGPTPVSALIHAATMVTAGVFMIARNAVLFAHAPAVLDLVALVGLATALFAGSIGLVQQDIKRVLAYSTISQLGLMFLAVGVGAFAAGIFHLYTHAFFKALLFLGAGAVIHALGGEQDIRRMGGLGRELPLTYWTFLAGAAALAGVPLLSGFFSKDEILLRTFAAGHPVRWALALGASLLTALYIFRLVFLVFHGEGPRAAPGAAVEPATGTEPARHDADAHAAPPRGPHVSLHDPPPSMAVPLVVLALGAVLAGYVGVPAALGGTNRFEQFLQPSFEPTGSGAADAVAAPGGGVEAPVAGEAHQATEIILMTVSSVVALGGVALAALFFWKRRELAAALARRFARIHRLLVNKYYVDELYDALVVQPTRRAAETVLWRGVDAGLIDGAVNGAGAAVEAASRTLRRLQSGSVRAYAAALVIGVVLVLGYSLWR